MTIPKVGDIWLKPSRNGMGNIHVLLTQLVHHNVDVNEYYFNVVCLENGKQYTSAIRTNSDAYTRAA